VSVPVTEMLLVVLCGEVALIVWLACIARKLDDIARNARGIDWELETARASEVRLGQKAADVVKALAEWVREGAGS
jgi:hypothetical protein